METPLKKKSGFSSIYFRYNKASKGSLLLKISVALIFSLTILEPGIQIRQGLPSLKISDLILILVFLKLVKSRPFNLSKLIFNKEIRSFSTPFAVFTIWVVGMTLVNLLNTEGGQIPSLLFGMATTLKGFLMSVVIIGVSKRNDILKLLVLVCILSIIFQILILFFQYYNFLDIGVKLTELYRVKIDERYLRTGARTVGTYGNPNATAIAIAILISIASSISVFHPKRHLRFVSFLLVSLSILSVMIFTRSRTGIAGVITAIFIVICAGLFCRETRIRALFSLLAGVVFVKMLMPFFAEGITWGIQDRFGVFIGDAQFAGDNSFSTRLGLWSDILRDMGAWSIFGDGFGATLGRIIDSGYIFIIAIGGFIGLLLYLFVVLMPLVKFIRYFPFASGIDLLCIVAGISCTAVLIVGSVGMTFYGANQIWSTYCGVISLGLVAVSKNACLIKRRRIDKLKKVKIS